jgi:hypothetical protein
VLRHTQYIHLERDTEQISQENCIFAKVHLKQKEDWYLDRDIIAIYNSFFSAQQEQEVIISLSKIMDNTNRV